MLASALAAASGPTIPGRIDCLPISFLGLSYRILILNHKKELLRGLCLSKFATSRMMDVKP